MNLKFCLQGNLYFCSELRSAWPFTLENFVFSPFIYGLSNYKDGFKIFQDSVYLCLCACSCLIREIYFFSHHVDMFPLVLSGLCC